MTMRSAGRPVATSCSTRAATWSTDAWTPSRSRSPALKRSGLSRLNQAAESELCQEPAGLEALSHRLEEGRRPGMTAPFLMVTERLGACGRMNLTCGSLAAQVVATCSTALLLAPEGSTKITRDESC